MPRGLIRFCYQKIIDATCTSNWDKCVFEDTYQEFFMQAQQYDQQKQYTTFQEIEKNIPKAAEMHYLVSTAAVGFIRQLNEKIPEVTNVFEKPCIPFKNFKFEIIQSHTQDKSKHKVAIYFFSEFVTWIDTVGNFFIIALADQQEALNKGQEVETETIMLRSGLSLSSYQRYRKE